MPRMADVRQITIDGITHESVVNVDTDISNKIQPASVPAAKSGTLTTRTSASVGTLTMSPGHGITTGQKADLYFSNGLIRYNVLIGTVATNSVPISGGGGDDLPAASTAVTVSVWNAETQAFAGDTVEALECYSPVPGTITFTEADGTTVINTPIPLKADSSVTPRYTMAWRTGQGTSPLAGGAVGKIMFTHGETTAKSGMSVIVFRN